MGAYEMPADAHRRKFSSNQTVQPDVRPRADPGQHGGSLVHLQRHLQNGLIKARAKLKRSRAAGEASRLAPLLFGILWFLDWACCSLYRVVRSLQSASDASLRYLRVSDSPQAESFLFVGQMVES